MGADALVSVAAEPRGAEESIEEVVVYDDDDDADADDEEEEYFIEEIVEEEEEEEVMEEDEFMEVFVDDSSEEVIVVSSDEELDGNQSDDDGDSNDDDEAYETESGSGDYFDDDSSAPPLSFDSDLNMYDDINSGFNSHDSAAPLEQLKMRKKEKQLEMQHAAVTEGARKAMEEALTRELSIQRQAAREALQRKGLEQEALKRLAEAAKTYVEEQDHTPIQQQYLLITKRRQQDEAARRRLIEEIRKVDLALSKKRDTTAPKVRLHGTAEVEKRKRALTELRRQAARDELARNNSQLKAAKASKAKRANIHGSASAAGAKSQQLLTNHTGKSSRKPTSPAVSAPGHISLDSGVLNFIQSVDVSSVSDLISPLRNSAGPEKQVMSLPSAPFASESECDPPDDPSNDSQEKERQPKSLPNTNSAATIDEPQSPCPKDMFASLEILSPPIPADDDGLSSASREKNLGPVICADSSKNPDIISADETDSTESKREPQDRSLEAKEYSDSGIGISSKRPTTNVHLRNDDTSEVPPLQPNIQAPSNYSRSTRSGSNNIDDASNEDTSGSREAMNESTNKSSKEAKTASSLLTDSVDQSPADNDKHSQIPNRIRVHSSFEETKCEIPGETLSDNRSAPMSHEVVGDPQLKNMKEGLMEIPIEMSQSLRSSVSFLPDKNDMAEVIGRRSSLRQVISPVKILSIFNKDPNATNMCTTTDLLVQPHHPRVAVRHIVESALTVEEDKATASTPQSKTAGKAAGKLSENTTAKRWKSFGKSASPLRVPSIFKKKPKSGTIRVEPKTLSLSPLVVKESPISRKSKLSFAPHASNLESVSFPLIETASFPSKTKTVTAKSLPTVVRQKPPNCDNKKLGIAAEAPKLVISGSRDRSAKKPAPLRVPSIFQKKKITDGTSERPESAPPPASRNFIPSLFQRKKEASEIEQMASPTRSPAPAISHKKKKSDVIIMEEPSNQSPSSSSKSPGPLSPWRRAKSMGHLNVPDHLKLPTDDSDSQPRKYYILEDLQERKVENIDYTQREQYLSPRAFEKCFKVTKATFAELPRWKQDQKKRQSGLF